MGFNSTVVVHNDALGEIREDPKFGQFLADAIADQYGTGKPVKVAAHGKRSINVVAAIVVEQHHADSTAIVAVGGNEGTRLDIVGGHSHTQPEDKLRILRSWAESMGYTLTKRRKQKWRI